MQQGNGQFVLPYTAHQVAASNGDMQHVHEMGEPIFQQILLASCQQALRP